MDARVPFSAYRCEVLPGWLDEKSQMNVAAYVHAFDQATEAFLQNLHLPYRCGEQNSCTTLVVDMNVTYKRPLQAGAMLHFDTQMLQFNHNKMRIMHQMFHDTEGFLAATNEVLLVHVDLNTNKSCAFSSNVLGRLQEVARHHNSLELPEDAGRVIQI